jgi:hypothetical protein
MNARQFGFRALAIGLGLLIGAAVVEIGLRLTGTTPVPIRRMAYAPRMPFDQLPHPPFVVYQKNFVGNQVYFGCTQTDCSPDMRVPFHTNAMRMRDRGHPLKKPEGTWRLLVLGDSFSVADGVHWMESWAQRLGVALDQDWPDRDVELFNTSQQAYSTLDQWHLLQYAIRFDPDMIAVGIYLNDAMPSTANWSARGVSRSDQEEHWTRYRAQNGPIGPWLPPFSAAERNQMSETGVNAHHFRGNVRRHRTFDQPLILLRWAAALSAGRQARTATLATIRTWWGPQNTLGQEEFRWSLAQLGKLQEDRGIPVVAVVFPWMDGLEGDYPFQDLHARIGDELDAAGIAHVDVLQAFQEAVRTGTFPWAHQTDHHPSSELHAVAADAMLPLVAAQAK